MPAGEPAVVEVYGWEISALFLGFMLISIGWQVFVAIISFFNSLYGGAKTIWLSRLKDEVLDVGVISLVLVFLDVSGGRGWGLGWWWDGACGVCVCVGLPRRGSAVLASGCTQALAYAACKHSHDAASPGGLKGTGPGWVRERGAWVGEARGWGGGRGGPGPGLGTRMTGSRN